MAKQRILIIDDSDMMRKAIKKSIISENIDIVEANDGYKGYELVLKEKFDLVVTDIDMPQLNGFELCKQIKNNHATRSTPVVMLSSMDSDEEVEKGFQAGATAYILKQEAKDTLKESINEILSNHLLKKNKLIMLVDDSTLIRKLIKEALEEVGFRVVMAENGRQALSLINIQTPDVVISDIDMPIMTGIEFFESLRSIPEYSTIPFVVMSANSNRGQMKRMINRGAVAYLVKPFNMDQLVILVEKLISDQFLSLLKEKERLSVENNSLMSIILNLVSTVEMRDPFLKGHSEQVAEIVSGMAAHAGASQHEIDIATLGAKLHDIGNLGIKDTILSKPGKLTVDEFSHIQLHTIIGANMLKNIQSLSETIPIILSHHERFDGKGYPHGLRGNKIPFWARIAAVANTYQAMTNNRAYRKAMPKETALEIIDESKETQLCPEAVELFFRWIAS
ncbi:MAG: response regulator [Desulfobacterales bacterium]|nr:response regulator [Desulfobacterales bacterium]